MAKKYRYNQKIVTLGGGTGHYSLLRGLVEKNSPELISAITGTWDNGGSSGRLRVEMGVLPPGDTRQCLLALMEDIEQRQVAQKLFNERFNASRGPLRGHALGNLIQSQLQIIYQGQDRALDAARALFRVKAHIVPISLSDLELCAKTSQGHVIEGETIIDTRGQKSSYDDKDKISRIYFDTTADPNPKALEAISRADKIVISAGDLYTSILPHFLVKRVSERVISSKAKLIFVLNLMTKKGETDHYKASDFLKSFFFYLGKLDRLDYLIVSGNHIDKNIERIYRKEGQELIKFDEIVCKQMDPNLKIVKGNVAKYSPKEHLLRHDPEVLAKLILNI